MIQFILLAVYIVGFFATLVLLYLTMKKGDTVSVLDLCLSLILASLSWTGVLIVGLLCYGDKVVFIKK